MMLRLILLSVVFTLIYGFLLDDKNQQTSVDQGKQYLTLDDKLQLIHDLEKIRNEQKGTINTLASQLKQRLSEMETQIMNANNTCKPKVEALESRYHQLEKNYTELRKSFQQLKSKHAKVEALESLEKNFTELRESFEQLQSKHALDNAAMQKKVHDYELKVNALDQLKNVDQLQFLATLDKKVKSVNASVRLLLIHEQARNQDFLALVDITKQSKSQFTEFQNRTAVNLQSLQNFQLQSSAQIKHIEETQNTTLVAVKQHGQLLSSIGQRVAITGCHSRIGIVTSGYIIKFPVIMTSVGVRQLSSFKSTGKFVCEVPGLYLISATVMSTTDDTHFCMRKNNNIQMYSYLGEIKNYYRTNTADMVMALTIGDTISVTSGKNMNIYNYSCLTIVKVT